MYSADRKKKVRSNTAGRDRRSNFDDIESDYEAVPEQYRELIDEIVERRVQERVEHEMANLDPAAKKKL